MAGARTALAVSHTVLYSVPSCLSGLILPSQLFVCLLQGISSDIKIFVYSVSVINETMENLGNAYLAPVKWDELGLKKSMAFSTPCSSLALNLTRKPREFMFED